MSGRFFRLSFTDRQRRFWRGGALLALTAVAMRMVSLAFNVYLTDRLGGEGMGLITLVLSVYGFAVTFATSGIQLSATRMVAAAIGRGSDREIRQAMRRCNLYALAFGTVGAVLLCGFAPLLAERLLKDASLALSLRILSPALPCIALSASLTGYFTAVRRVRKAAAKTVFEQGVKIALTVLGLRLLLPRGTGYSCLAVVGGSSLAELLSFFLAWILYRRDLRAVGRGGVPASGLFRELCRIALPVAFTAYVRSGLLTAEHLLIPRGLTAHGASRVAALTDYGCIQSMALPVVLFPLGILGAFTGLLIPELSEAAARKDPAAVDSLSGRALSLTLRCACCWTALLTVFALPLGEALFPGSRAGRFILALAPLIPVMYFDTAVDAVLKGLGEQVYSMKVNILDAAVSTLLVAAVLPLTGIAGYLPIIWVTEWLNMGLSYRRAAKIARFRLALRRDLFRPLLFAFAAALAGRLTAGALPLPPVPKLALGLFLGGGLCLLGLLRPVKSGILAGEGCNLGKSVV